MRVVCTLDFVLYVVGSVDGMRFEFVRFLTFRFVVVCLYAAFECLLHYVAQVCYDLCC